MKAPSLFDKIKDPEMQPKLKKAALGTGAVAIIVTVLVLGYRFGSMGAGGSPAGSHVSAAHDPHEESDSHDEKEDGHSKSKHGGPSAHSSQASWFQKTWDTYKHALETVQTRVDELREADEEVVRLRNENAHLRIALEVARSESLAHQAKLSHDSAVAKAKKETWTPTGRSESTIGYQPPEHLTPDQMYTLALSYFKAREDEKAAKIFSVLLRSDEGAGGQIQQQAQIYQTASNYMIAGISWYRIDNLKVAGEYFQKARELDRDGYGDQVRLWNALMSRRQGDHRKSQDYMRQVLDRNPHSMEAQWINPGESGSKAAKRGIASSRASHMSHTSKEDDDGHAEKPAEDSAAKKQNDEH